MKVILRSKIRIGYIAQRIIVLLVMFLLIVGIVNHCYKNNIDYSYYIFWVSLFFITLFLLPIIDFFRNVIKSLVFTESEIIETKLFGVIVKRIKYSDIIRQQRQKEYSSSGRVRISDGYYKTVFFLKNNERLIVSQNQYVNYTEIKNFIQNKLKE